MARVNHRKRASTSRVRQSSVSHLTKYTQNVSVPHSWRHMWRPEFKNQSTPESSNTIEMLRIEPSSISIESECTQTNSKLTPPHLRDQITSIQIDLCTVVKRKMQTPRARKALHLSPAVITEGFVTEPWSHGSPESIHYNFFLQLLFFH